MDILASLLRIILVLLLVRAILAITAGIIMTRKMKKAQENAEIDMLNKKLMEQKLQQQAEERKAQMVRDDYCGKLIDKSKAFIIRTGDKYHHFCSWECRQKYLENSRIAEGNSAGLLNN